MHSMSTMWLSAHTPLHILQFTFLAIGIIAAALWLAKSDKQTVLTAGAVALILGVLLGYPLTGTWTDMSMSGNMKSMDMNNMMEMMGDEDHMQDMMQMMQMGAMGGTEEEVSPEAHDAHHPEDEVVVPPQDNS